MRDKTTDKRTLSGAIAVVALLLASFPGPASIAQGVGFTIENPVVVTTFDGKKIIATLMLPEGASPENPVPVLIKTNGWGTTRPQYPAAFDATFLERGYAIFAWDSRGFGESEGKSHWNDPDFEVRDVKALLDHLAERPEIQQDGPGDPRVGWLGGSYAGGIQWNTAAVDQRLDAITPRASGGNYVTDMLPNDVYKFGIFAKTLSKPGRFAKPVVDLFEHVNAVYKMRKKDKNWLRERSSTKWVPKVTTPTLVLAGTVDQAFPLQDAFRNYRTLVKNNVPVKMVAYCGGHGQLCPYPGNDVGDPDAPKGTVPLWVTRTIQWLDRYVKEDDVGTGPAVELQGQTGYYYAADRYPWPGQKWKTSKAIFTGPLGGPADKARGEARISTKHRIFDGFGQAKALFGRPKITISSSLAGRRGYVFVSLIDKSPKGKRKTIGKQVVPVTLREKNETLKLRLNAVSWILKKGHAVELKINTGTPGFRMATADRYELSLHVQVKLPLAKKPPKQPVP